jgi:phosphoglycolate phosphatase
MNRLVLFDIDGTILRFKKPHSKVIFQDVLKKLFGWEILLELMPGFAGKTDLQILKEISRINNFDFGLIKENIDSIWKEMTLHLLKYCKKEYIELLAGVSELIVDLNKREDIFLGLLTGNYKQSAYLKLKVFDLSYYFKFGAFGSDSENRNHLPAIAIERANAYFESKLFDRNNTVIIGDSPLDIECARKNDIRNVIVSTGNFSLEELSSYHPDVLLNDFSDRSLTLNAILGHNS